MQLLRRINPFWFSDSPACQKLRKNLIPRNGGNLCIPRESVCKYFNKQYDQALDAMKKGVELIPEVDLFRRAVYHTPALRMCYEGAIDSIPEGGCMHGANYDAVFYMMNNICISAPEFQDKDITGVPFYALFFDFLDTRFGMAFFGSSIVNSHLKDIFNAYSIMLQSDVSLKYMNK